jgi:predicted nuclease of predicted toxin-antitoxin system
MNVKLDENLPRGLVFGLGLLGHDVHTPRDEGLSAARDSEIWEAAQLDHRFLVTQDLDFSDVRRFTPGTHCGILLIRLREPSRTTLTARIESLFRHEDVESGGDALLWPLISKFECGGRRAIRQAVRISNPAARRRPIMRG